MDLIEAIKSIEGGEEVVFCPPKQINGSLEMRDSLMARLAVGLYRGELLQQGLCPQKLSLWFISLPENVAKFHLWNAWHRK